MGEYIYPMAVDFDQRLAGKLTGMLADALVRLQDQVDVGWVLSTPQFLWELVSYD